MDKEVKLYYDTNEVAEMLDCEPSAIRYWENNFPQLSPKRDSRNRRRFNERDIEIIRKIMHQKEKQGRTIKGVREQLRKKEEAQLLIQRLLRVRKFLTDFKEVL